MLGKMAEISLDDLANLLPQQCSMNAKLIAAGLITVCAVTGASRAEAGQRGTAVGRAVPRAVAPRVVSPRIISPRVGSVVPYRPYYYRPRFGVSLYYGYPYGFYPYGFYGYYGGYGYPYAYPGYAYPGYGYPGYVTASPGVAYGGVRIVDAPRDARVFVDNYYVGIVDDFDGVLQHINLPAGPHHVEIRPNGGPAFAFDVNVEPGQTVTYHAR
jgi:hypothetical protein